MYLWCCVAVLCRKAVQSPASCSCSRWYKWQVASAGIPVESLLGPEKVVVVEAVVVAVYRLCSRQSLRERVLLSPSDRTGYRQASQTIGRTLQQSSENRQAGRRSNGRRDAESGGAVVRLSQVVVQGRGSGVPQLS